MKTKLQQLEEQRRKYQALTWKSNIGVKTRIQDMDDSYLVNCLRKVGEKLAIAERYPAVDEFQGYEGVSYYTYSSCMYNEYLYRQELVNEEYRDYLDYEIALQDRYDRDYYDDRDLM